MSELRDAYVNVSTTEGTREDEVGVQIKVQDSKVSSQATEQDKRSDSSKNSFGGYHHRVFYQPWMQRIAEILCENKYILATCFLVFASISIAGLLTVVYAASNFEVASKNFVSLGIGPGKCSTITFLID